MKTTRTLLIPIHMMLAFALVVAGCDSPSSPEEDSPNDAAPRHFTRADLTTEGTVTETENGYRVEGALHVDTDEGQTSFVDADLNVEFDENGVVRNVTGTATVPSPSDEIEFADPVQADVGFFSGKYLNENRDFNILLKDDTDYFVFHISVTFEMRVGSGNDGETKPLVLKAPLGGSILMIMDFNDPMAYTYAAQDLLGDAGFGQSRQGRLPFRPVMPVENFGRFDGRNIRTGSFPMMKIINVEGEMIDNRQTMLHLTQADPFDIELEKGYRAGINGAMSIDLFVKDIVGIDLPLGQASAGYKVVASIDTDLNAGLEANAWINGVVDPDYSWWPNFIPVKPAQNLSAKGLVTSSGRFDMAIAGEFGIETPDGFSGMTGGFRLTQDDLTLEGSVVSNDVAYAVFGHVDADATTIGVHPPQELIDQISGRVNSEIDERIGEAEAAWNELQEATEDYEFELSLRGLRGALPGIVDAAKKSLSDGIANELKKHEGKVYYNSLRDHLHSKDDAYYSRLNNLKNQAQATTDNDAWRAAIESALRGIASYKFFETTYTYNAPWPVPDVTVNIKKRIMSDTNANKLTTAANNVRFIKESSDRKIKAKQVYDQIPDKEIFEKLRDDIEDGLVAIPDLGELGMVVPHGEPENAEVFVVIAGERLVVAQVSLFDMLAMVAEVSAAMVDDLIGE